MDAILIVNAGSSSLKFQVFETDGKNDLKRLIKGQLDGIGTRPRLRAEASDRTTLVDQTYVPDHIADASAAIRVAQAWLRGTQKVNIIAVGHRIVHGGPEYDQPIVVNSQILGKLEQYASLAPLHQPNNLAPIRAVLSQHPDILQVACFDTAFHRCHDAFADHYAIPEYFYEEGVRRYGFHGLSYEFIAGRLRQVAPHIADRRVIVAHLGSGASMCALLGGRSIESTMGFTALDGLPMGTRPGQIDPGIVLYLIGEKSMTPSDVQNLLYRDCGLKGLSGISNDVRELETSEDPRAKFALDYFAYRIALCAGMLTAALGGLDAFVFTGGIGENSAPMRARVAERLEWVSVALDSGANTAGRTLISCPDSKVAVYIIPTDEELMIARHTLALLSGSAQAGSPSARTVA
jgi:acetate kinase